MLPCFFLKCLPCGILKISSLEYDKIKYYVQDIRLNARENMTMSKHISTLFKGVTMWGEKTQDKQFIQ